jgi:hypothetical protein
MAMRTGIDSRGKVQKVQGKFYIGGMACRAMDKRRNAENEDLAVTAYNLFMPRK